jgi:hypothetical protein
VRKSIAAARCVKLPKEKHPLLWIAPEQAGDELIPFPAGFDHLRAIPVQGTTP